MSYSQNVEMDSSNSISVVRLEENKYHKQTVV
uniref:Uncharacterized protein n=1 Tax=Anguilla anguilla TaxID=7936 RepID=A0A0E9WHQ8_ANGAN